EQSDLWPSVVNAVTVMPGYEAALGAALGDDLTASADAGAPVHWQNLPPFEAVPALPPGAEPMTVFMQGPALLTRRLMQIGIVADETEGRTLAPRLAQGQRLVTRDGAMWRWDGFTVGAGAAAVAETRLRQRTRLGELQQQLTGLRAALSEAEATHAEAKHTADETMAAERQWRDAFQASLRMVDAARATMETATQRALAATSRAAALDEAATAMGADV